MLNFVKAWYYRYFSDDEAIVLFLILSGSFLVIFTLGEILVPVITAVILAYLMQGLVNRLRVHLPEMVSILLVYALFIGSLSAVLLVLLPLSWTQLSSFLDEQLPLMIGEIQSLLTMLPQRYPGLISEQLAAEWIHLGQTALGNLGKDILSFSFSKLPNLMALLIFLVLVPLLVFFFMKDKAVIIEYCIRFLPPHRPIINRVWEEMDNQISNYVRGKVVEIIIVGGATYVGLVVFGVKYSALLGLLVGLSVVIPYIGAVVVTIPVVLVAYFQFGTTQEFLWVMVVYGVIQALDGNILVPLLFSEAVKIHPIGIVVAVLVFGGLWGLWGVFFAIPLATLIKAVFTAWPRVGAGLIATESVESAKTGDSVV